MNTNLKSEGCYAKNIDSDNKKKLESQYFFKKFLASTGIYKTEILKNKKLQRDYAKWLVQNLLDLKSVPNQKGFDAVDAQNYTYKIKFRCVNHLLESTSFDFYRDYEKFDFLVGVLFSHDLNVLRIICTNYEIFTKLGKKNMNTFRFRWNKKNSEDTQVKRLI